MDSEALAALRDGLARDGVRYLFGAYVDMHGVPKSKCVPVGHLADMAAGSELYTVGALEGMGPLGPNEDECVAIPDLSALTVLPWDRRYAVAPASLWLHDQPYPHDFRRLLQNQLTEAAALGYRVNMGIEPELYVLRRGGRRLGALDRRGHGQPPDQGIRPGDDHARRRLPRADGRLHQ